MPLNFYAEKTVPLPLTKELEDANYSEYECVSETFLDGDRGKYDFDDPLNWDTIKEQNASETPDKM